MPVLAMPCHDHCVQARESCSSFVHAIFGLTGGIRWYVGGGYVIPLSRHPFSGLSLWDKRFHALWQLPKNSVHVSACMHLYLKWGGGGGCSTLSPRIVYMYMHMHMYMHIYMHMYMYMTCTCTCTCACACPGLVSKN